MIKDDPQPRIEELAYTMKTQALLILGAVVSACASTSSVQNEGVTPPPAFEAFTPSRSAYKIVPGDQLEISFLAALEFLTPFQNIFFELLIQLFLQRH